MSSDAYPYPVALARLSKGEQSHEPKNLRAIRWLLQQPGGSVVVVTPQAKIPSDSLAKLVKRPSVRHQKWRSSSAGSLAGHRVIHAWPVRQRLKDIWGVKMDALAVIEWSESQTAAWIDEANPIQLYADHVVEPAESANVKVAADPLPNDVDEVLQYLALAATEYGSDMEWHEEQKLKADMMHRPDLWASVTVKQVRERSRALGLSPNDVDTISEYLQRRKDGRRFIVDRSYRDFQFN